MTTSPLLRRYGMTARRARSGIAEALRERDLLLIVQERGAVVGFAWVVLARAFDRSAYLRLLLVAEDAQSRGVGAALLEEAERRARAAGSRHFMFFVTADNRRARAFYERHGHERVATLRSFVRPRIDEAIYVKTFRAPRR